MGISYAEASEHNVDQAMQLGQVVLRACLEVEDVETFGSWGDAAALGGGQPKL